MLEKAVKNICHIYNLNVTCYINQLSIVENTFGNKGSQAASAFTESKTGAPA